MTETTPETIPTLQPAGLNPAPGPQADFMAAGDPSVEANEQPPVETQAEPPPADDPAPADIPLNIPGVTLTTLSAEGLTDQAKAVHERAQALVAEGKTPEEIARTLHEEFNNAQVGASEIEKAQVIANGGAAADALLAKSAE